MTRPNRAPWRVAAAVLGLVFGVSACSAASSGDSGTATGRVSSTSESRALTGTVTVLAASSLTESFTTVAEQFMAAHPAVQVTLSFGPSSGLARAILAGAPADVFASASPIPMATLTEAKAARSSTVFATNSLAIAVPPDNPAHIAALTDLTRPGVTVAVCQEQVPCGSVAKAVLEAEHLRITPVTQEADVKAVLTKVQLGEVDAGLVYRTDVLAAGGKVASVALPRSAASVTDYPITVLAGSSNPAGAAAFVAYVLSPRGQAILKARGFATP